MLPQSKLNQIIRSVERLRPMPTNVTRTLVALEDPMTTAGMVSELIGLDQALSALVLQFANSATLGYGPVCSSLLNAVMRLGFKRIKTILLGAAASGSINQTLAGYRLGAGGLWNHSVATATAAQIIGRTLSYPDPEEAYVAGLLHDMGKLLLDQYVLVDYGRIADMINKNQLLLWQAEEKLFGIDHAGVGGLMAQKWNFPLKLIEPIRFHHAPAQAKENPRLSSIVNLANAYASREELGASDPNGKVVHPEAMRILNLTDAHVERIMKDLESSLKIGIASNNG